MTNAERANHIIDMLFEHENQATQGAVLWALGEVCGSTQKGLSHEEWHEDVYAILLALMGRAAVLTLRLLSKGYFVFKAGKIELEDQDDGTV